MARKSLYNYIFTPGAANAGTVIIPDPYKLGDILMITNVTRNTVIYNFGDSNRGGSIVYTNDTNATLTSPAGTALSAGQTIFTNLNQGYTTITLSADTSSMSSTDVLQIYVESQELKVRPYDFGVDAVERMKIAAPQSLIDADFEYGMQPTKWITYQTVHDIPVMHEYPGTDTFPTQGSYATFLIANSSAASVSTWLQNPAQVNMGVINQGQTVSSAAPTQQQNGPNLVVNQLAMIIAQGQAGQANSAAAVTSITPQLPIQVQTGGIFQRTFSVANTAAFNPGDVICAVEMPGEGAKGDGPNGAYVASVKTLGQITAGNVTLGVNVQVGGSIVANSIILVQTTQPYTWEAMGIITAAAGDAAGAVLTVQRNLWGTNPGNAAIQAGAPIRSLAGNTAQATNTSNVEIMRVDSIDNSQQMSVTRSWFNVNASPTFGANSIIFKVNHSANQVTSPMNSANIEIVRMTTVNNSTFVTTGGGNLVVRRGEAGTQPLAHAGTGSLLITLTGTFAAGNAYVPAVYSYVPGQGLTANLGMYSNANIANCYVSTLTVNQGYQSGNVEGVHINQTNDANYIKYFPRFNPNMLPGSQLNIADTQYTVRRGGIYTGGNILVANITSNVGSPSLITVSTLYPHGLIPAQLVQAQIQAGNQVTNLGFGGPNILEGASGQFVITSTPTPQTFTYITKANLAIQANGVSGLTGNITMYATGLVRHRPADGGNNIGNHSPAHGYEITRQTKKYFRYQSGKGMMFTTGTQYNPVYPVANITAAGTSIGSAITIVVEQDHGLQIGANVRVYGVTTSGYNGFYRVATVSNGNRFTVLATSVLGATTPTWAGSRPGSTAYTGSSYPRVAVLNWHGAKIRSGMFDDGNGLFCEYDGQTFWAVKRTSTVDLAGRISCSVSSPLVIGDVNTRFQDQLVAGDIIQIRGMTHTVAAVLDQQRMIIAPTYRGVVNAIDSRYTKISEERTPQYAFNQDRVDGTGPSGYVMDLSKMQMIGIQYTWYGAGFTDYMVRAVDGRMIIMHRSKGNNMNDEAYMRSGNLPARYQASNRTKRTWLSTALYPTSTEVRLYDVSEFPTANATYPVTVMVDNELITYSQGPFAANGNIAGLTRGASLTVHNLGASRTTFMGMNSGASGTWVNQGLPTQAAWSAQCFNPNGNNGNGVWIAVAGKDSASTASAYSLDGHSWIAGGALPSSSTWCSVAYQQIGGVDYIVAIAGHTSAGSAAAYSTNNGQTWTSASLPTSQNWSKVAAGFDNANQPVFVAISGFGGAGSTATAYSTNGTTWTAGGALSATQLWNGIAFGKTTASGIGSFATDQTAGGRTNYFLAVSGTSGTTINYSTDGGKTWTAKTLPGTQTFSDIAFGNNTWIAVGGPTATQAFQWCHGNPVTGVWTSSATGMPSSSNWKSIAYHPWVSGHTGANTVNVGTFVSVSETAAGTVAAYVNNLKDVTQTVTPTWSTSTLPFAPPSGTSWISVAAGQGFFSAISNSSAINATALTFSPMNSTATNTTTQWPVSGWASTALLLPSNYQAAAYGAGNIVVLSGTAASVGSNISLDGGRKWGAGGVSPVGQAYTSMAFGPFIGNTNQGRFVAVATGSQTPVYQDAQNLGSTWWTTGAVLPSSAAWQSICYVGNYGQGAFVTVANTSSTAAAYSFNGGASWVSNTLPSSSNWSSVAGGQFGVVAGQQTPIYNVVAVSATSGTIAAYANVFLANTTGNTTLSSWTASTLSSTGTWTAVAYGIVNGVPAFVAIASNGTATAVSTNGGISWSAGATLPSSDNWTRIVFAENSGQWVAIANTPGRGTVAAYSNDPTSTGSWTAATLPVSANWSNLVWAREFNQFVAISGDTNNASANVSVAVGTGGKAAYHTANTGVRVVSVTASPDLNHWGSAVILDGGFNTDRTYTFTYNVTNFAPQGTQAAGQPWTAFMMRLAPTISSSLTGELGVKEMVNRAQVLLASMYINIGNPGSRYLLQGLLNPTNIGWANWRPLNNPSTSLQPSFTQFVANSGTINTNIFFTSNTAAIGGEQLFAIPVTQTNSGFLDLSQIKEITSMAIPGTGAYPNGPEILAINFIPTVAASGTANVDVQITYIESQA